MSDPSRQSADGSRFATHEETDAAPGRVTTPSGTLHYLNVAGTLTSMGRQTGEKLAELVAEGPIPTLTTFLAERLRNAPASRFSNVLHWATDRWAADELIDQINGEYRRALDAMAAPLALSTDSLLEASALPESLLWLTGTLHRVLGARGLPGFGSAPIGGSSSAVVRPPGAPTTLHGRNLDYFGFGPWERTACVQFYHPEAGLDYVAVGAAGVFGGGFTAMNAAGLTLAVHQHVIDEFDLGGVPVGIAGDRVMRRAHGIDEAVEILRDHPPVAGWSYVLTEGDTGDCAVVELAPGREALHRLPDDENRLAYTNRYWGEQLAEIEIDFYPEYRRDVHARQTRATQRTGELVDGEATPRAMASILGDFHDPTEDRERLVGRTIASVNTISSVVFEPERRRIWVGSGPSPASRGWFVPFRLRRADRPDLGGPDPDAEPFHPSPGWDRTSHGKAFELYRQACVEASEGETDKRLLIRIEHALALYPEDPALHLLGGLLALRNGRGRRAEGAFRRALERFNDLSRRAEATLYLAWALDLQDERSSARQMYREVRRMPSADPAVERRARAGRWLAFTEEKARRLSIDFIHVGVY